MSYRHDSSRRWDARRCTVQDEANPSSSSQPAAFCRVALVSAEARESSLAEPRLRGGIEGAWLREASPRETMRARRRERLASETAGDKERCLKGTPRADATPAQPPAA